MEGIEIVIGTYENLVLGYHIRKKIDGDFTFESSFTTDSHRGALRCLALSKQGVLASTSTDDSIRLHSLKKRREVGSLFQHDGSVNCIRFFKGGYMFSASEDGTICLWKCKTWELMRVLKGHKCHVLSMAIHPSAKLGLSVGSDRTFFTWDLTTGKLAFKRKTDNVIQDILFTQDGDSYLLVSERKIEVCSLEDTTVQQEIDFESRINAVCLVNENVLAVGGDDGGVSFVNVITGEKLVNKPFKGRIKALYCLTTSTDIFLVVACSNGCIRVCRMNVEEGSEDAEVLVTYESGVRITCMAAYAPPNASKEEDEPKEVTGEKKNKQAGKEQGLTKKRKRDENGNESEHEETKEEEAEDSGESSNPELGPDSSEEESQPLPKRTLKTAKKGKKKKSPSKHKVESTTKKILKSSKKRKADVVTSPKKKRRVS